MNVFVTSNMLADTLTGEEKLQRRTKLFSSANEFSVIEMKYHIVNLNKEKYTSGGTYISDVMLLQWCHQIKVTSNTTGVYFFGQ